MIKIKLNIDDKSYHLEVVGHANYALYGNDIVCSAVSTALIMTANLFLKYNNGYNIIKLDSNEGNFILKIKRDEFVDIVCDNLVDTLKQIVKQYPKNVTING